MVEFIKVWCEEIIVSVIIAIIIEMFVPQGNIKKYVRVIVGIYIIFVIINPIIVNIDNINLENIIESEKNYNTVVTSNMEEMSNVYARAMENEIKKEFSYISKVRVVLTDNLDDIARIEITLLEDIASVKELKENLINNYGITEDKISII